jgi:hypothetical protein
MPLQIIRKGNLDCPCPVCDHCGRVIERGDDGNYEWTVDEEGNPNSPLFFIHKRCSYDFEKSHGGFTMNMELELLPAFLGKNLAVNRNRVKSMIDTISGFRGLANADNAR